MIGVDTGVDTVLCLGISVLSTYSYYPFISTTIYPKILSNNLNLSCFMNDKKQLMAVIYNPSLTVLVSTLLELYSC